MLYYCSFIILTLACIRQPWIKFKYISQLISRILLKAWPDVNIMFHQFLLHTSDVDLTSLTYVRRLTYGGDAYLTSFQVKECRGLTLICHDFKQCLLGVVGRPDSVTIVAFRFDNLYKNAKKYH